MLFVEIVLSEWSEDTLVLSSTLSSGSTCTSGELSAATGVSGVGLLDLELPEVDMAADLLLLDFDD